MLRSAASKVMWLGRATVFLVGLAVTRRSPACRTILSGFIHLPREDSVPARGGVGREASRPRGCEVSDALRYAWPSSGGPRGRHPGYYGEATGEPKKGVVPCDGSSSPSAVSHKNERLKFVLCLSPDGEVRVEVERGWWLASRERPARGARIAHRGYRVTGGKINSRLVQSLRRAQSTPRGGGGCSGVTEHGEVLPR